MTVAVMVLFMLVECNCSLYFGFSENNAYIYKQGIVAETHGFLISKGLMVKFWEITGSVKIKSQTLYLSLRGVPNSLCRDSENAKNGCLWWDSAA